jgi:hypothetical protein
VTRAALFEKIGFGACFAGLLLWICAGDLFWGLAGDIALLLCVTAYEEDEGSR